MSLDRSLASLLLVVLTLAVAAAAVADEPHHAHAADAADPHAGHGHTDRLHFTHPLITESPLPENEARLGYGFANLSGGGGDEHTLTASVEWAPVRWLSFEASAPFTHLNPDDGHAETRLGDVGLGLKLACFAFEDRGLLLATGLELGLPSGNEERGIGNDHVVEIEPWVGFGYKRGPFEWVARVGVGLPLNQNDEREADAELEWSTSLLVHVIEERLAVLVEIDGLDIYGDQEDGFDAVSVTPAVRFYPFDNPDISFGLGVRLPVTTDREQHVQTVFTVYFHY